MKSQHKHNVAIAAIGACWLTLIARTRAFQYGQAAQRDERKGFRYTAALEWRNAAELFPRQTRAADYCWRQWERIMHVPRHLAMPVDDSLEIARPMLPDPAASPEINPKFETLTIAA